MTKLLCVLLAALAFPPAEQPMKPRLTPSRSRPRYLLRNRSLPTPARPRRRNPLTPPVQTRKPTPARRNPP